MEFNYIIDNIHNAEVKHTPWPYINTENFLKTEHLQLLIDDWHSINWQKHKVKKEEYVRSWEEPNWVRDYFSKESSKELKNFLSSKPVFDALQQKFNVSQEWQNIWVKRMFKRDDAGQGDYSHTDITVDSHMVLQIFFPDQSYDEFGTVMQSYEAQPIEQAVELPMQINSATIFVNTPDTWHAVKPGNRLRKSYIQRFLFKEGHNPYNEQRIIQMAY